MGRTNKKATTSSSSSNTSTSSSQRQKKAKKKTRRATRISSSSTSQSSRHPKARSQAVVVLDSDDSPERPAAGHRRDDVKAARKQSRSGVQKKPKSASRQRSRSRRRSRRRAKSRSRKRSSEPGKRSCSPGYRPVWSRGGRASEPPLPTYALAYLPKAALEAAEALAEQPRAETGLRLLGELCQTTGARWDYVLKDETRRCFAGHLKCPFSAEQCNQFFKLANEGTEWKRPRDMPRGTAWMVAQGCSCNYRYAGYEVEPQVYPNWMLQIMRAAMPFCGLEQPSHWPNSCNLNLYDTGGSSVAWHADDEPLFNGKFQDVRIVSLSLGVRRTFELRANIQNDSKATQRMSLGDGDLCTMEGMTQKHYQHRVPPEGSIEGPRINLTWRWLIRHTPMCPAGRTR